MTLVLVASCYVLYQGFEWLTLMMPHLIHQQNYNLVYVQTIGHISSIYHEVRFNSVVSFCKISISLHFMQDYKVF